MGLCVSSLDEDIKELSQTTHYTSKMLQRWKKKFLKKNPGGMLTQGEFEKVYEQMYTTSFSNHLVQHIFRSMDTNDDGHISFKVCYFKSGAHVSCTVYKAEVN